MVTINFVNFDLKNVSNALDPMVFTDYANLFISNTVTTLMHFLTF